MNNAVEVKPAFESEQVQAALKSRKQRQASIKPITELIDEIKQQNERIDDRLVPFSQLRTAVVATKHDEKVTEEGVEAEPTNFGIRFKVGEEEMPFYESVIQQACNITSIGDKAGVPAAYIKRLLNDDRDQQLVNLAAVSLNEFYERRSGEMHTRGKKVQKQVFVRSLKNEAGVPVVRALLSDKYFVLNNLDIAVNALAIVTKTGDGGTAAKDARAFDWHLDPFRFELGFVNPGVAFDLKNPEQGLIRCDGKQDDHGWVYSGGGSFDLRNGWQGRLGEGDKSQHLVLPAARISNSETGGGSAEIQPMLFETICTNGVVFAKAMKRTHVSSIISEADEYESDGTKKKAMEWVISKMTDALKQVFDLNSFQDNCRKFLKLKDTELKSDRVKEVSEFLLSAIPGGDGLLDDILKSMEQFTPGRTTLLDVTRAITSVAQDQPHDRQAAMEELAGTLTDGGLTVPERHLLAAGVRRLSSSSVAAQQSEVRAA